MCMNLSLIFFHGCLKVLLSFMGMFHEKRVCLPSLNQNCLLGLWLEVLYILCEHLMFGYGNVGTAFY